MRRILYSGKKGADYIWTDEHVRMSYLVATDGSEEGADAVSYAAKHAAVFKQTLEIVHVLTLDTELIEGELIMQDQDTATDEGEQILDRAVDVATEAVPSHELDIETTLLTGRPAPAITDRASEIDANAIFVGHRGLSSEQEAVVGSVAKQVVSRATVPVTVVR